MPTFKIDDFAGGRDVRPRLFYGKAKNSFRNLTNAYIGKDRQVHRRFPLRFPGGSAVGPLGAVEVDGVLTFIQTKLTTPAVSIPGVTTNVIQFDEYPNHQAVELLDAKIFNGHVVALIKHLYTGLFSPSGAIKYTSVLHVFDGLANKPTYVEDPYFPVSWGATLPLHTYRTGTIGHYVDFTPRMGVTAGKIYISGPDGNTYFSAPNNARVWNTRTQPQITSEGEWFYWPNYDPYSAGLLDTRILNGGVPLWVVSEDFTQLSLEGRWSCYVLEYCDSNGTWTKLIEDNPLGVAPSVDGHYQVVPAVSRFGGTPEIGFKIYSTSIIGPIFRFRLIVGAPPITIVSGNVWSDENTRTAGQITFEGGAIYNTLAQALGALAGDRFVYLTTAVPGTFADDRVSFNNASSSSAFAQLTGYQRYHSLITGWDWRQGASAINSFASYLLQVNTSAGTIYGYGYVTGNETTFFLDRKAKEAGLAGNGLAGFLPTAALAKQAGGFVTALSVIKSYLGIHYRTITLLYAVNANQLLDTLKDTTDLGTGQFTDGLAVQFYNQTILLSERGFRAFYVGGFQSDRADDTNIGEAVETFGLTDSLQGAAFWPYTGQYLASMLVAAVPHCYVFDYSRESKISAWSKWDVGISPLGKHGIIPIGSRLYFYNGSIVAYLDAAASDGQFYDDLRFPDGLAIRSPYVSTAECYQNDLNAPGKGKRFTAIDVVARGQTTVEFTVLSSNNERVIPAGVIQGSSIGGKRVRLAMISPSVAPKFSSSDENEWVLDSYSLDYVLTKR